jgi:hypothetical protein
MTLISWWFQFTSVNLDILWNIQAARCLSLSPSFRPMAGQTGGHFEREELVCAFVQLLYIIPRREFDDNLIFFFFFLSARERERQGTYQSGMSLTFGSELSPSGMRADHHHFSFFFLSFFFFSYLLLLYTYTFCEFLVFPLHFFLFSIFYFSTHVQKSLETCRFLISTERVQQHPKKKKKEREKHTRVLRLLLYIYSTWHTPCIGRARILCSFSLL